jgi:hypothetical protein
MRRLSLAAAVQCGSRRPRSRVTRSSPTTSSQVSQRMSRWTETAPRAAVTLGHGSRDGECPTNGVSGFHFGSSDAPTDTSEEPVVVRLA